MLNLRLVLCTLQIAAFLEHTSVMGQVEPGSENQQCQIVTNHFCLPKTYNKYQAPKTKTEVDIDLRIEQVTKVDDVDATVDFVAYIRTTWEEGRLIHLNVSDDDTSVLNMGWQEKLWLADIYFYRLKRLKRAKILQPITALIVYHSPTKIQFSQQPQVKFWCQMDFSFYPFDSQVCHFLIGSYAHKANQMTFRLNELVNMVHSGHTSTNLDYKFKIDPIHTYNMTFFDDVYSVVGFTLTLDRYHAKYVINYYLPSSIIVVVSWISFLIPQHVVPGRMALLITLLLVLINLFGTVILMQPPSKSPTALAIWILCCIMFVSGALLAYAALLYDEYMRVRVACKTHGNQQRSKEHETVHRHMIFNYKKWCQDIEESPRKWDRRFIIAFPCLFLLFNLIHWPMVLLWQPIKSKPPVIWYP